ncbi:hypothetical protein [Oleidesulfovibrio sp.]|uniref:hypothetical protein n=1 Tax=Oleidesulfovibrio sp. TaxID=2909707 RepID=UPI003A884A15
MEIQETEAFRRSVDKVLKKYPRAAKDIEDGINSVASNPDQGMSYPGIEPVVKKTRLGMPSYKQGKRGGMRLIYIAKTMLTPIFLYVKGQFSSEGEIKEATKKQAKEVIEELSAKR